MINPITTDIWEGIRARHSLVESAGQPTEAARAMAYLSHLDRRILIAEIERLQMRLKRHEPVSLYNGHDIDWWKTEAERLRADVLELRRANVSLAMRDAVEPGERPSCRCPALPGEDCPLTNEQCLERTTEKSKCAHPQVDHGGCLAQTCPDCDELI